MTIENKEDQKFYESYNLKEKEINEKFVKFTEDNDSKKIALESELKIEIRKNKIELVTNIKEELNFLNKNNEIDFLLEIFNFYFERIKALNALISKFYTIDDSVIGNNMLKEDIWEKLIDNFDNSFNMMVYLRDQSVYKLNELVECKE